MKSIVTLLFCTLFVGANAQLPTLPEKQKHISEEDYNKGKYILENSIRQIGNDEFCYADYWNFAVGLSYTGGNSEEIWDYLKKAKAKNTDSFCEVVKHTKKDKSVKKSAFYKLFGEKYLELIEDCSDENSEEKQPISLNDSKYNGLNKVLISELQALSELDKKYRKGKNTYAENWAAQTKIDVANTQRITQIFEKYGYPGKSLVGDEFNDHAAIILIHSCDISIQEKYLPLLVKAWQQEEISIGVLTILLDKIHWKKTGKQVFGTQMGIPVDSETVIENTKKRYGIL